MFLILSLFDLKLMALVLFALSESFLDFLLLEPCFFLYRFEQLTLQNFSSQFPYELLFLPAHSAQLKLVFVLLFEPDGVDVDFGGVLSFFGVVKRFSSFLAGLTGNGFELSFITYPSMTWVKML